jgi:hypothetical protein
MHLVRSKHLENIPSLEIFQQLGTSTLAINFKDFNDPLDCKIAIELLFTKFSDLRKKLQLLKVTP